MEYLIRFAQQHESFRLPEIEALATLAGIDLEIISYNDYAPYCIVKLKDEAAARALIRRSILSKDIYELWGQGSTYDEVHADVRRRTPHLWAQYQKTPFAFHVECFAGKRSHSTKMEIIQSFSYVGFTGPIRLKNPDQQWWVMEEYVSDVEAATPEGMPQSAEPRKIYLGRKIAEGNRSAVDKYDLKKRKYISTTSMDAELSLVTANMAHAAPGKLFFDPFVGTGSFIVSAAHFGALTLGSDIDGRAFRGSADGRKDGMCLLQNYRQYGHMSQFVEAFVSDLTNSPLRRAQFLDGIVCDPPYGVREGLRVLGMKDGRGKQPVYIDGVPAHYRPGYIAPKKPYGFEALQNDILDFAAQTLVSDGRLSMWMPTASDEDVEFPIPMHPNLQVLSVSVQPFNNWSRRLITYRRLPEGEVSDVSLARSKADDLGMSADDLNAFRRKVKT
ncbi:uncharacterized protein PFLUO_LOCUS8937 [Penicillium psychrofluorescens]|uniref:uncharacterized protein n=1 Tax=Penicillium psychrofluorescens TaxID=3158075 RepID=UPI003CCDB2BE